MHETAEHAAYQRELARHLRDLEAAFAALERQAQAAYAKAVRARDARRLSAAKHELQS